MIDGERFMAIKCIVARRAPALAEMADMVFFWN
jgi:hypothetical protein